MSWARPEQGMYVALVGLLVGVVGSMGVGRISARCCSG